jgi:hypothetical protein
MDWTCKCSAVFGEGDLPWEGESPAMPSSLRLGSGRWQSTVLARRPFRLLVVGYEPFVGASDSRPRARCGGPPVTVCTINSATTQTKTSVLSGRRRHGEPGNDLKNGQRL